MQGTNLPEDHEENLPDKPKIILPSTISATVERQRFDEQMRLLRELNPSCHFERNNYSIISDFIDEASEDYDSDLRNPYWSFAHEILKFILRKFIADHFKEGQKIRLFDAGAGTANWSRFVLGLNERISGTLFEMNTRMLKVAHPKIAELHGNAVRITEGNLEVLTDFPSEPSNLVLCMHNVIGMGRNTNLILSNLYRYIEEGGLAFIMTTNAYHAFSTSRRSFEMIEARCGSSVMVRLNSRKICQRCFAIRRRNLRKFFAPPDLSRSLFSGSQSRSILRSRTPKCSELAQPIGS